jgi:hypothetical protein
MSGDVPYCPGALFSPKFDSWAAGTTPDPRLKSAVRGNGLPAGAIDAGGKFGIAETRPWCLARRPHQGYREGRSRVYWVDSNQLPEKPEIALGSILGGGKRVGVGAALGCPPPVDLTR